MTLHELSRLYLLKKDRAELHARLEELWTAATRVTSLMDGMPKTPFQQQSRVEKYAASIADVKKELAELEIEILQEECALRRYIFTVPDSEMRLILGFRFVDCLSWREVANNMKYNNATEDSVKMAVYRFLKAEAQNSP